MTISLSVPDIARTSVLTFFGLLLLGAPSLLSAQSDEQAILRTVEAVYAGISANEDESRDWPAFHAMFLPDARLISVGRNAEGVRVSDSSVPEWVLRSGLRMEGRGFVEDVLHNTVRSYGPIAQVFTSWVTRSERGGSENSHGAATLQLVRTQDGWRVATWIWTGEVEGIPLPRG